MITAKQISRSKLAGVMFGAAACLGCVESVAGPQNGQASRDLLAFSIDGGLTAGVCHATDEGSLKYIRLSPEQADRHFEHGDSPAPCTIDFDFPVVNQRQVIHPYVSAGVTFSAEPWRGFIGAVGLVWNGVTSACVPPQDSDQTLGTTPNTSNSVGLSGFPIRATFQSQLPVGATISAEVQTGAGALIRLRLYGRKGRLLATRLTLAAPPAGTCFPGMDRARTRIAASVNDEVAFAIIDVSPDNFVFVIDDFQFGDR